jgi:hypothetical protein
MGPDQHPAVYEIPTRVWLGELGRGRRRLRLDEVPEETLAGLGHLARLGIDAVWLLGVWQTGPAGRLVARHHAGVRHACQAALPDLREDDIGSSPFAVRRYGVHAGLGGDEALRSLRRQLERRGLGLLLDFVPNHTALDHPWVAAHPEWYLHGSEADLAREPGAWRRVATARGEAILAHGRDPNFPAWTDTLQLNHLHPGLRAALREELERVAGLCDGVRCDMAMLVLPEVFERTWGERARPVDGSEPAKGSFWEEAIPALRERRPGFLFLAEAYWDLEWTLQQQGFDFTYDKRLYDRLRSRDAGAVRAHLAAEDAFQRRCARFLENHDEERAASAFPAEVHRPAALLTYLLPGLRLFHDGQLEGRAVRLPVQLRRRQRETPDAGLHAFYERILGLLRRPELRGGRFRLASCRRAWEGSPAEASFVAFTRETGDARLLVAANYGPAPAQGFVALPLGDAALAGRRVRLRDLVGPACYERDGDELAAGGLYLDLPGWGHHVFEVA